MLWHIVAHKPLKGQLSVELDVQSIQWSEHVVRYSMGHYLNLWEFIDNGVQFVPEVLLGELHFSHIKRSDPRYLVMLVDNSWCLPLCL